MRSKLYCNAFESFGSHDCHHNTVESLGVQQPPTQAVAPSTPVSPLNEAPPLTILSSQVREEIRTHGYPDTQTNVTAVPHVKYMYKVYGSSPRVVNTASKCEAVTLRELAEYVMVWKTPSPTNELYSSPKQLSWKRSLNPYLAQTRWNGTSWEHNGAYFYEPTLPIQGDI